VLRKEIKKPCGVTPYVLVEENQLNCHYKQLLKAKRNGIAIFLSVCLTLRLLMSYIYGAPSKARNANVVYIWTYVWQR